MIKDEAYELMGKGYAVTHKLFRNGEYLYMDKSFIIRDEEGITFEADWDVRTSPEWLVDWFVYKGKRTAPRQSSYGFRKPKITAKKTNLLENSLGPVYDMVRDDIDVIGDMLNGDSNTIIEIDEDNTVTTLDDTDMYLTDIPEEVGKKKDSIISIILHHILFMICLLMIHVIAAYISSIFIVICGATISKMAYIIVFSITVHIIVISLIKLFTHIKENKRR